MGGPSPSPGGGLPGLEGTPPAPVPAGGVGVVPPRRPPHLGDHPQLGPVGVRPVHLPSPHGAGGGSGVGARLPGPFPGSPGGPPPPRPGLGRRPFPHDLAAAPLLPLGAR